MSNAIFKKRDNVILRKTGSLIIYVILMFLTVYEAQEVSRERKLLMGKNQYLLKLYENKDITPKEREHLLNRIDDVDYFLAHKRPFILDLYLAILGAVAFTVWSVSFPIWVVKKKKKEL